MKVVFETDERDLQWPMPRTVAHTVSNGADQ